MISFFDDWVDLSASLRHLGFGTSFRTDGVMLMCFVSLPGWRVCPFALLRHLVFESLLWGGWRHVDVFFCFHSRMASSISLRHFGTSLLNRHFEVDGVMWARYVYMYFTF